MAELKSIIEQSMAQYAGAVLQSRALIDVRDGLKPSARQIFYCMDKYKYTADKPYQKSAAAVGDALKHFYIHGDTSCLGIIMRAGQQFAMRYPLITVKGNGGTLIESGNWAAMRYTESRLSKLGGLLFEDIDKDTIAEWRDNYSETEQYPMVLPSKGFYNIVNGSMGIGIGMACSIPQYNITEVNNALIHLIDNPDCDFDEIYCAPDFATGAILYNEAEVKESMKNGQGFACKLRSVVEFDSKERCFVVTEIPYSVYTNTICAELEALIESEENPGIERFNDLTGKTPLIKIYLTKKANPDKVLRYLYKNTSLQYYYSINFTMLDRGRFPKVFTWKEMLQAHIDHEKEVYHRGFEFDLKKIEKRIHIIDGLLICLASIEEVVQTIKSSTSTATASLALQNNFLLDEEQAKAVLDMKLSRLAHLEVKKLENEKATLQTEAVRIQNILNDEQLFNEEIKSGWRATIKAYGDERRTKILNLASTSDEPIEVKQLQISLTNKNNIIANESSTLYVQRRGGVGKKMKLEDGEYIISSITVNSNEELLLFSQTGIVYHYNSSALSIEEKIPIISLVPLKDWEQICAITSLNTNKDKKYICFITKNGIIKKSEIAEYSTNRAVGVKAIALDEGDEIISIMFINNEKVGILSDNGNFLIIETESIRPIGRVARGVRAIKLDNGAFVVSAKVIPEHTSSIISISGNGLFKKTNYNEFNIQTRGTKGTRIQRNNEGDWSADFLPITTDKEILIASTRSCIKLTTKDVPISSKGALGVKSIKLTEKDNIIGIS